MYLLSENKIDVIKNFAKDKLRITVGFFASMITIILFYYLYTDGKVPVVYPSIIAIFVYIFFMAFEFYEYYKFNYNVHNFVENCGYSTDSNRNEYKRVEDVVNSIHSKYLKEITEMGEDVENNNKIFSQWIHNMKTPVAVIDIIIQKVRENENLDYKMLDEVEEENNKLLNNLNQVLSMLRLEDFSKDYVPEVVDLNESIKNIIKEKKKEFIYSKVYPEKNYKDEKILIISDKKWNEFMIGQIINNAIKYSKCENQSKTVYFEVKKSGEYTELSIRDEGIGIPDYDIRRVFEPFFTGENGRKIKNSTGIGLYICRVVCEKLGYEISLESGVNKGTIVKIRYLSKL